MRGPRDGDSTPTVFLEALIALANGPADIGPACVIWPFALTGKGYAAINRDGTMRKVSHLVLERTGNPRLDPPNHHALHYCDTPACVHPGHLSWGSHRENMRDKSNRGRSGKGITTLHRQPVDSVDDANPVDSVGGGA